MIGYIYFWCLSVQVYMLHDVLSQEVDSPGIHFFSVMLLCITFYNIGLSTFSYFHLHIFSSGVKKALHKYAENETS